MTMRILIGMVGVIAVLVMAPPRGDSMAEAGAGGYVEYFQSFAGYSLPLKPVHKISKEEAEASRTYCVGYFNDGKLVRLTRVLDGAKFFDHVYVYYPDGRLRHAEVTNRDGVVKTHDF
jgi:hypothetical protein